MQKLIQSYFSSVSRVAPGLAGEQAFNLFATPKNKKISAAEASFYSAALRTRIHGDAEDLWVYETGNPWGEVVLLVHGWASNAGSMSGIGAQLSLQGYRVISFDLPAHGNSRLKRTNLRECATAFQSVFAHYGSPAHIVTHSFGSAVVTFGLTEVPHKIESLVFLTSPDRLSDVFTDFANMLKLSDTSREFIFQRAEALLNRPVSEVNVHEMLSTLNVGRFLMIHDTHDRVVPIAWGERIVSSRENSEVITLTKAGHYKMLWNEEVFRGIRQFFSFEAA